MNRASGFYPVGRGFESLLAYHWKEVSFVIQPVKFETQEDLFRFSELASKEDFPIYISTAYGQLDARSLLGLFTILGKDVNIVVGDHANADKFSAFLHKYANS